METGYLITVVIVAFTLLGLVIYFVWSALSEVDRIQKDLTEYGYYDDEEN